MYIHYTILGSFKESNVCYLKENLKSLPYTWALVPRNLLLSLTRNRSFMCVVLSFSPSQFTVPSFHTLTGVVSVLAIDACPIISNFTQWGHLWVSSARIGLFQITVTVIYSGCSSYHSYVSGRHFLTLTLQHLKITSLSGNNSLSQNMPIYLC